eukprot:8046291-Pyramimonas_sp.AAC.1
MSAANLPLDLVGAFYSAIGQLALALPGEEAKLAEAFESIELPSCLEEGVEAALGTNAGLEGA